MVITITGIVNRIETWADSVSPSTFVYSSFYRLSEWALAGAVHAFGYARIAALLSADALAWLNSVMGLSPYV